MLAPLPIFRQEPLDRMARAVRSHRAVSGIMRSKVGDLRFRFLAPSCLYLEGLAVQGIVVTDGTTAGALYPASRLYVRSEPARALATANAVVGYSLLLKNPRLDLLRALKSAWVSESAGTLTFDVSALRAEIDRQWPEPDDLGRAILRNRRYPRRMEIDLDPRTGLPKEMRTAIEPGRDVETYRFENVVLDPPLRPSDFRFIVPEGYRDATLPLPPLPRRQRVLPPETFGAKPGAWTADGLPPLRVSPSPRLAGGDWTIEVESRKQGAYDLRGMKATARFGKDWRIATPFLKPGRTFVAVPTEGSEKPPDALRLDLTLNGGMVSRQVTFIFEWRA